MWPKSPAFCSSPRRVGWGWSVQELIVHAAKCPREQPLPTGTPPAAARKGEETEASEAERRQGKPVERV